MTTCLFDFWSRIGPTESIHPADRDVFQRLGSAGHAFSHEALPGCFMGPLRTARVVLLFMSPGLSPEDKIFARTQEGVDWHVAQRTGYQDLPDNRVPGGKWWVERTKCFRVDPAALVSKVAFLNIGAYHSKEMTDPELLAALPSSRVCLDWAQSVLFPEALCGKRVVVCLRAAKFWGLRPEAPYDGTLFAPRVTRGGHMVHGMGRDIVVKAVCSALN